MAIIKVPKTPASAYNPERKPNDLILAQVRGLQSALRERGGKTQKVNPDTEARAAAIVRHLTRGLHDKTLLPDSKIALTMVETVEKSKRSKKSKPKKSKKPVRKPAPRRRPRKGRRER